MSDNVFPISGGGSSLVNDLVYINAGTDPLKGSYNGGDIWISKIGKMVTLTWNPMAHASSAAPTSLAGFIPVGYRPITTTRNVVVWSTTKIYRVDLFSNGTMSFSYGTMSTGTAIAETASPEGSISYYVL